MSETRQHLSRAGGRVGGEKRPAITEAPMTVRTTLTSPLGDLLLVGDEIGDGITLTSLSMPGQRGAPTGSRRDSEPFADVVRQLGAYFDGELTAFDLRFSGGGTDFQQRVWQALE